jgi:hypothetical protein
MMTPDGRVHSDPVTRIPSARPMRESALLATREILIFCKNVMVRYALVREVIHGN